MMVDSSEGAAEERFISQERRVLEAVCTEQHFQDSFHMGLALIHVGKRIL